VSSRRLALLVLAFLVPPVLTGATTVAWRLRPQGGRLDAAAGGITIPGPRPPANRLPLAVILAGNHGTEITDSLPIVELLAASGAFEVRVVAPRRAPSPFATSAGRQAGLDFVPDLGFDDYAGLAPRAPALLVVPYLPRWQSEDGAVIPWLRAHAGPDTTVLSICRGAELVAASGLFDGHVATANAGMLDILERRHPAVRWQRGIRWVRDGRRMSSSLLAGGLDATLAAIDELAGRPAAQRAVAETGYPGLRALGDRSQPAAAIPVGLVLDGAYRWEREQAGLVLADGVAEGAVAGLLDGYAATYTTDIVAVSDTGGLVRSRHGLALLPRGGRGDLAAGVRPVLATGGPRAYGYDLAIAEIARHRGGSTARGVAQLLNYPITQLELPGGAMSVLLRPLLIGLASLLAVAWWSRRKSPCNAGAWPASSVQSAQWSAPHKEERHHEQSEAERVPV
jgi:putative intracellular protease/amidase